LGKNNFVDGGNCLRKFVLCFCSGLVFCDISPIWKHQFVHFKSVDDQVNILQELRKIFEYIFTASEFGMVAAAI
jgi:hypothetical protein